MNIGPISFLISCVIGVIVFFIIFIPTVLWHTLVLFILWGWFAVPLGFPALTWSQWIGLYFIKTMLLLKNVQSKDKRPLWARIFWDMAGPGIILLMAFFCKTFLM